MSAQPELSRRGAGRRPQPDPAASGGAVRPRPRGRPARRHPEGDRRVRQHRLHVHLRQRLLPRRAPHAAGQDQAARAVAAGAVRDGRPRDPARRALRPGHHARTSPRRSRDLAGATSRMPYPEDGGSVVPVVRPRPWLVGRRSSPRAWSRAACFPTLPMLKAAGFHDARNTIGVRTAALEVRPLLRRGRRALRPRPRPQRAAERRRATRRTPRCATSCTRCGSTTRTASARPAVPRCRSGSAAPRPRTSWAPTPSPGVSSAATATGADLDQRPGGGR